MAAMRQILEISEGIGVDATAVCTDNGPANDWILRSLHPQGTCVILGLTEGELNFAAFI
jgi:threonine dehydrogenase-like Zn-dependent dehydrogenase